MSDNLAEQVEMRLTSHGVYVQEFAREDGGCEITYESAAVDTNDVIPHKEVGNVINVFRELHDDGWEGIDIAAVVTDFEGTEYGRWRVDQGWLDRLHNGDLSEVEFSQKVIETIEYNE